VRQATKRMYRSVGLAAAVFAAGCGIDATLFNPQFLNTLGDNFYPSTPGPNASFVFVRVINETDSAVEFVVTAEKEVRVLDEDGNVQFDDEGNVLSRLELETVRLRTLPELSVNQTGVLFPCSVNAIRRVGLGESLLPGDAAALVTDDYNAETNVIGVGFGVPSNINPLSEIDGNFACGDTVIFQAFSRSAVGSTSGGDIYFSSFVDYSADNPGTFDGPDTFANYERFLQTQVREDEP
jgi:hypothetical protein